MARGERESWRVERRDSIELLARANTLTDVAICEGSWLYLAIYGGGVSGVVGVVSAPLGL